MKTLVLCSQSPRRKQILEAASICFHVHSLKVSESFDNNLSLDDALMAIARSKSSAVLNSPKLLKLKSVLLLSGDTVVVLDNKVLGKPKNQDQAFEFLRLMSSKTHTVKTSICLWDIDTNKVLTEVVNSEVTFKKLSDEFIKYYISTGEPMDKAGAYGIQDHTEKMIEKVIGSRENVMGLPIQRLEQIFLENNWLIERNKK